jgi:hypothetical protein
MARPRKNDAVRRSVTLSVRVTSDLRKMLDEAAGNSERPVTISQEIERRLLDSFAIDQKIDEMFHGRRNYWFAQIVADGITESIERITKAKWWDDPFTFDEATRFIDEVLRYLRPNGKRLVPKHLRTQLVPMARIGDKTPEKLRKKMIPIPSPFPKKGDVGKWVANTILMSYQLTAENKILLGRDRASLKLAAASSLGIPWRETIVAQLRMSGLSPEDYFGNGPVLPKRRRSKP